MPAKAPQTEPVLPANLPSTFNDDLAYRCFPHRFRRIGSPYAYLNDVGLPPILEFIYKGHLLIDVAEAVNVPLTVLRTWVEQEGHLESIADAETVSAEGYLAEGMRRLRTAPTEFELRRAKEMIKHAQYMAGKKNKPTYGEAVNAAPHAAVTYVFNVPDSKSAQQLAGNVIDSTSNRIEAQSAIPEQPSVSMDLGTMFGLSNVPMDAAYERQENSARERSVRTLAHLMTEPETPQPTTPEPVLVASRPAKPTPKNPDIGPFYDDPTDQEPATPQGV